MNPHRLATLGVRMLMALSFGLLAAGSPNSATAPADFTLDFVADFKGNIEPCG